MYKNSQNKKGFLARLGAFFEAIAEVIGDYFDDFDADFD